MRIIELLDKKSISLSAAPKTKNECLDMAVDLISLLVLERSFHKYYKVIVTVLAGECNDISTGSFELSSLNSL